MKLIRFRVVLAILLVLGILGTFEIVRSANVFELSHWYAGSGIAMNGEMYTLGGSAGQPLSGHSQGGNFDLSSGFWFPGMNVPLQQNERIFLPLVE